jgi:hypothetical protein
VNEFFFSIIWLWFRSICLCTRVTCARVIFLSYYWWYFSSLHQSGLVEDTHVFYQGSYKYDVDLSGADVWHFTSRIIEWMVFGEREWASPLRYPTALWPCPELAWPEQSRSPGMWVAWVKYPVQLIGFTSKFLCLHNISWRKCHVISVRKKTSPRPWVEGQWEPSSRPHQKSLLLPTTDSIIFLYYLIYPYKFFNSLTIVTFF